MANQNWFSELFKGLPLRKVELLCGQGGSIVSVTVKDERGNLATVDEWGKVIWRMSADIPGREADGTIKT